MTATNLAYRRVEKWLLEAPRWERENQEEYEDAYPQAGVHVLPGGRGRYSDPTAAVGLRMAERTLSPEHLAKLRIMRFIRVVTTRFLSPEERHVLRLQRKRTWEDETCGAEMVEAWSRLVNKTARAALLAGLLDLST